MWMGFCGFQRPGPSSRSPPKRPNPPRPQPRQGPKCGPGRAAGLSVLLKWVARPPWALLFGCCDCALWNCAVARQQRASTCPCAPSMGAVAIGGLRTAHARYQQHGTSACPPAWHCARSLRIHTAQDHLQESNFLIHGTSAYLSASLDKCGTY